MEEAINPIKLLCRRLEEPSVNSHGELELWVTDADAKLYDWKKHRGITSFRIFSFSFNWEASFSGFSAIQYFLRAVGMRQCFLHPCQKQESTKITVLYFGKTISGFPKYLLEFLRYFKPFFQSSLRNSVSILLSLLLT